MTKTPYRGQDQTIELIRKRAIEKWPTEYTTSVPDDLWKKHWEFHANELADEMEAEGLVTTAAKIRSFSKSAKRFQ